MPPTINATAIRSRRAASSPEGIVRQVGVPGAVLEFSTLDRIDYADTFLVKTGPTRIRTAEQWARAILEDAPLALRAALLSGWSTIDLKVGWGQPGRLVCGWEVRRSTPNMVLLGADSRIRMPGELLFVCEQHALLVATFVQHRSAIARAVWAGVEPMHVPVARHVLEQAGRRFR